MNRSEFLIKKMDCPSEESIIRMKLNGIEEIKSLNFDIPNRKLTVFHLGNLKKIEQSINDLNFNSSLLKTESVAETEFLIQTEKDQTKLLWKVLLINFAFFVIEISTGFISGSMGLIADSLDMLADAFVYGLSLLAVGGTLSKKKNVARISGYFQILLAMVGMIEVVRRFLGYEEMPDFYIMIFISLCALAANATCLYLLQKFKSNEVHMKASMIFTSNDVVINLGVVAAGLLVYFLESNKPDLIIGTIVFIIVCRGAMNILKLSKG